ncbi:MAG: hypothetical protein M1400_02285 [Patescibacteria group bacterium]|nr:hypothetical protein [Patescibacteria group bacterium]
MKTAAFEKVKAQVFFRQRVLAEIYEKAGSQALGDYAAAWPTQSLSKDNPVLKSLQTSLGKVYGQAVAGAVAGQLQSSGLVSTIDHHGLFGHPFFLSANLIFAQRPGLRYLPVLSTSGVSLNNSSWPGCVVLTHPETGRLIRFSLFNDGHKTKTVFKSRPVSRKQTDSVLARMGRVDFLSATHKNRMANLLEKVFSDPRLASLSSFSEQASLISSGVWQELFPLAPQLVYLPLEELAGQILADRVCAEQNHVLHRLFFTQEGLELLHKHFYGVRGGYGQARGSFLFWGVGAQGKRVALQHADNHLVGGDLRFELSPSAIFRKLELREIYPTSLVCFLVLLHAGVTALGGFNQTTWLDEIRLRFVELLEEAGESSVAAAVASVATKNFSEGGLAFTRSQSGLVKAAALDLYAAGTGFDFFQQLAKKITLAQSIESELPEIYRIVVLEKDRQAELSRLTLEEISRLNGLDSLV